jgi:predicted metal-dependent hydrolase
MVATAPETVTVHLPGGKLQVPVIRSEARRLSMMLQVTREGAVVVRVPARAPRRDVVAFVRSRAEWLAAAIARIAQAPPAAPPQPLDGSTVPIWGEPHIVRVRRAIGRPRPRVTVGAGEVEIVVGLDGRPGLTLARWLAASAGPRLREMVDRWAPVAGVQPRAVLVRDQKTRRGSCSTSGDIRFNWRLAMLDPWVVEGVVAHELCHLLVPNHSPAFWAEVRRVQPGHDERRARLKAIERERALPALTD